MNSKKILSFTFFLSLAAASCAFAGYYRFSDAPPVTQADDAKNSPVPSESREFKYVEYAVSSAVRYPLVDTLDTRRKPRSQDVNSMDQVPASAWFTPRLGADNLSPEELVKGPEVKGAPQAPYTIVKAKTEGNSPGFIIKDARGLKYLIKFDRSEYPGLESTVNYIVNRLYWGFGYHVPEDFIIHFSADDAKLGEGISQDDVDKVYIFSYTSEDGTYRAVASRFIEGKVLGHIAPRGTRKGDTNDLIAHENRRTLRGLRMLSAWVGNSGFRSDNTLEVYTGEPGQGHTVHYILDFGENFGVHGEEKSRPWDGFEYFFSWGDTAKTFLTFGIPVKKWEDFKMDTDSKLGNFEADLFEPGKWKETTQFLPIRSSQADDDYWAAKIIAAVKPEHLQALFTHADHPEESYTKAVLDILAKRRDRVIAYAFTRVSPLEFSNLTDGKLILKDLGRDHGLEASEYKVRFLNSKGRKAAPDTIITGGKEIEVSISQALEAAKGYLIVEVTAIRAGKAAPRAAQFHIRSNSNSGSGSPKLAGIVH